MSHHPSHNTIHQSRAELRRTIRIQRRATTPEQRHRASHAVVDSISSSRLFKRSRHIALYLANDGELDPSLLAEYAHQHGKRLYLPVLSPVRQNRLQFAPYHPNTLLAENRFGIPEPVVSQRQMIPPRALDLVLAPLVAFDNSGNRLGMGGGFYDRTFAFLHHRRHWQKPRLLGIAYEFQRVALLPHQQWDVPLSGIATEAGIEYFS